MERSENITGIGSFSIFTPPPRIGRIWCHPLSIGRNLVTPPPFPLTYNFLITPLYVFYCLICAISVFLIISIIGQNLVASLRRLAKSGFPILTNGQIWHPFKILHPVSNVFWTVPIRQVTGVTNLNPFYKSFMPTISIRSWTTCWTHTTDTVHFKKQLFLPILTCTQSPTQSHIYGSLNILSTQRWSIFEKNVKPASPYFCMSLMTPCRP